MPVRYAYTIEQKTFAVSLLLQRVTGRDVIVRFTARFPDANVPALTTVLAWLKKFKNTGNVNRSHTRIRQNPDKIDEEKRMMICALAEMREPRLSSKAIAAECDISKTSVLRVLKEEKCKSCRPHSSQVLLTMDRPAHLAEICNRKKL